jgi:hypothetical protein
MKINIHLMTEKKMNDEYKKGYADGFRDGHKAGLDSIYWRPNPPGAPAYGCPVCGLCYKDGTIGYYCPRIDCPTKFTCRSEVGYTTGET